MPPPAVEEVAPPPSPAAGVTTEDMLKLIETIAGQLNVLSSKVDDLTNSINKLKIDVVTRYRSYLNTYVTGTYKLFEYDGRGKLKEAVFLCNRFPTYVIVDIDRIETISFSSSELQSVSDYSQYFDAYQYEENYIIRLVDLVFLKNVQVWFKTEVPVTIKFGYILYDVRVET